MSSLLVGSVFSGTASSALNARWYELQLRMLKATLPRARVEHVVCLSQGQPAEPFKDSKVVSHEKRKGNPDTRNHAANLNKLRDYFISRRRQFDAFLFLDSDAFPCRKGWFPLLIRDMTHRPAKGYDQGPFDMAAIVRAENLSWYPHPSACFCLPSALDKMDWTVAGGTLFNGKHMWDPGVAMTEQEYYPLLRTNRINLHPLLCGIYGRMFYHHGAGSRPSRGFHGSGYYGIRTLHDQWQEKLFDAPLKFIKGIDW